MLTKVSLTVFVSTCDMDVYVAQRTRCAFENITSRSLDYTSLGMLPYIMYLSLLTAAD